MKKDEKITLGVFGGIAIAGLIMLFVGIYLSYDLYLVRSKGNRTKAKILKTGTQSRSFKSTQDTCRPTISFKEGTKRIRHEFLVGSSKSCYVLDAKVPIVYLRDEHGKLHVKFDNWLDNLFMPALFVILGIGFGGIGWILFFISFRTYNGRSKKKKKKKS